MGSFSSRLDVYVKRFSNPKVQELQKTFKFRGIVVPGEKYLLFEDGKRFINPFSNEIISRTDEEHSIVILGIYILFIDNETNYNLSINVNSLFAGSHLNQDVPHVDDTGNISILCPAKYSGAVNGIDRILYKPRVCDSVLRACAGMEEVIVAPLPANQDPLILDITHPLVYFIIENMTILEATHAHFHRNAHSETYHISREFALRAQSLFRATIYNDLHKTRFADTQMECLLPKQLCDEMSGRKNDAFVPNVTGILQLNYLSILPGQSKMGFMELKE
jgi:hypothetical protein